MKITTQKLTDLEIANIEFQRQGKRGYQVSGEDTTKDLIGENLTTVVVPDPDLIKSDIEGISDVEYTVGVKQFLDQQVADGWELVREEAKEALAINPNDETAKANLAAYDRWKKNPAGFVIVKGQKFKGQRATGVWQRTRDFGWLIKVSGKGTVVGEVVNVRKKGGQTIPMELTEEVVPNYFRAREV